MSSWLIFLLSFVISFVISAGVTGLTLEAFARRRHKRIMRRYDNVLKQIGEDTLRSLDKYRR
jgi:putative effector of murein hydrolase LrgA (UPF0299 family)